MNEKYADQLVSPYAAAGIVNKLLEQDGSSRRVLPQMLYQYTKSGRIPTTEQLVNGKTRRFIRLEDLGMWYESYRDGLTAGSSVDIGGLTDVVRTMVDGSPDADLEAEIARAEQDAKQTESVETK